MLIKNEKRQILDKVECYYDDDDSSVRNRQMMLLYGSFQDLIGKVSNCMMVDGSKELKLYYEVIKIDKSDQRQ